MSAAGAAKSSVSRRRITSWDVLAKEDGNDYWRLAEAFLRSGIRQPDLAQTPGDHPAFILGVGKATMRFTTLSRAHPKRLVFLVETEEGRFLLKRMRVGTLGLGRLFPNTPGLTRYTRLFHKVRAAIDAGCRSTQDYLMVAERRDGRFRLEVVTVLEYVDGELLGERDDYAPYVPRLREAVRDLLAHGLTLEDLNPHNFIVARDGIKIIDLSCRPPTRVNAVKMTMKMNRRYGLGIPIRGVADNLLRLVLGGWIRVRRWLGKGR